MPKGPGMVSVKLPLSHHTNPALSFNHTRKQKRKNHIYKHKAEGKSSLMLCYCFRPNLRHFFKLCPNWGHR